MFEFFLALFGGGYYATKFVSEKSKEKAADRRIAARAITIKHMESKLVNDRMESEIKDKYFVLENKDAIISELKDDLAYVYGDNWMSKVQLYPAPPPGKTYDLRSDTLWIFHLLLSKKGLVPGLRYIGGYELGRLHDVKEEIRFCECIEKNLKDAGHDISLALDASFDYSRETLRGGLIRLDFLIQDKATAMRLW